MMVLVAHFLSSYNVSDATLNTKITPKILGYLVILLALFYRAGHVYLKYYRHRNWQSQDSNPALSITETTFFNLNFPSWVEIKNISSNPI